MCATRFASGMNFVRVKGPALTGVNGRLSQPRLQLYKVGSAVPVGENTGWSSGTPAQTAALEAAFDQAVLPRFPVGSADCALLATVSAGTAYTAVVSGVGDSTGVALVEVYEVGPGTARMSALSCRARVGTDGDVLIPGIIILGSSPKQVIVRASAPQNVEGALARPTLALYSATGAKIAENTGWSTAANATELFAATPTCGLTNFTAGSADCAILISLPPGGYSALVSGVGGTTGVSLVEVYEVP